MNVRLTDEEAKVSRDKHPVAAHALRRIVQEGLLPEGPVERIEVNFLASGEVTYRVWAPRAEEPEGGYLAAK